MLEPALQPASPFGAEQDGNLSLFLGGFDVANRSCKTSAIRIRFDIADGRFDSLHSDLEPSVFSYS